MQEALREALTGGRLDQGGWQDGAVVDLTRPGAPEIAYLVGDIHAKLSRLEAVYARVAEDLEQERAVLIFLGDLFHREEDERAGEMDSSVATFTRYLDLKTRHPRHLYALLGNHEFTRTRRVKRGYFQGDLFRSALEEAGLYALYGEFLASAALVAVHPACAAVHAAPADGVDSLDDLRSLRPADVAAESMDPRIVALTCHRHRNWAPRAERSYGDSDVERFLQVCGVHQGPLITGHTPLCRETDWTWRMGPRNHVIFAAGRDLGMVRADHGGLRFVRIGRSHPQDDDQFLPDRAPNPPQPQPGCSWEDGPWPGVRLDHPTGPIRLWPDVRYRFRHTRRAWLIGGGTPQPLSILSFAQLTTASSYYGLGHYLVAEESRLQLLRLNTQEAILVGSHLRLGGPWPVREAELLIIRHGDEGDFEVQALVEGLWLQEA